MLSPFKKFVYDGSVFTSDKLSQHFNVDSDWFGDDLCDLLNSSG